MRAELRRNISLRILLMLVLTVSLLSATGLTTTPSGLPAWDPVRQDSCNRSQAGR